MGFDFALRRERFLGALAKAGLDGALLVDPLSVFYFTGVMIRPYERFLGLVADIRSGGCTLVLPGLEKDAPVDPAVRKMAVDDREDPMDRLRPLVAGCKRLGVEMNKVPLGRVRSLLDGFGDQEPPEMADATPAVMELRGIKDADEAGAMASATAISDEILAHMKTLIRPGITEKQAAFAIYEQMSRRAGVLLGHPVIQVLAGPNGANPHGTSGDRAFAIKDTVVVDFGLCFNGYWSDVTRTFFVGEPTEEMARVYGIVKEAQQTAIRMIRPGLQLKQVDLAARRVIEDAGFGEFFIHRTGHGLGLDIHEPPSVHGENPDVLVEGMTFTVEPGIYLPGKNGVRIEDDVMVTADSVRVFNQFSKKIEDMILPPD